MELPFFVSPSDSPAKQRILIESLRLFTHRGLDNTTIRDIAEATGFTNPALYRHFASKEALAEHLFEECYRHIHDAIASSLTDTSFKPLLRAYVERAVGLYYDCPEAFLYVDEHLRRLWPQVAGRLRTRSLVAQAAHLIALSPAAKRQAVPLPMLLSAVLGTFNQWARFTYFGEGLPSPKAAASALEAVMLRILR
jgi:TetR/AcrR family transcriptional regulator, repressor of fatR-cypB operon